MLCTRPGGLCQHQVGVCWCGLAGVQDGRSALLSRPATFRGRLSSSPTLVAESACYSVTLANEIIVAKLS